MALLPLSESPHEMVAIRNARAGDAPHIARIAETSGLLTAVEARFFVAGFDPTEAWSVEAADPPEGAAWLVPEPMSDNVWNLRFIAVARDAQRRGIGRALLGTAEAVARKADGRILLIDTSSDGRQGPARGLYAASGYGHAATVADFYGDGVDRLTFARRL